MNLEKEKRAIWSEAERDCGWPFSQQLRDVIEGDLEYIDDEIYLSDLGSQIADFTDKVKLLAPFRNNEGKVPKTEPMKRYRKPFERRLHLIDFIWNKKGGIRARANWKQITTEWNKEHRYDQKAQAVLKVEYYRTLNDDDVIKNWAAIKIAPLIKEAAHKTIDFWHQHREAKNLNELIELAEVNHEGLHSQKK